MSRFYNVWGIFFVAMIAFDDQMMIIYGHFLFKMISDITRGEVITAPIRVHFHLLVCFMVFILRISLWDFIGGL